MLMPVVMVGWSGRGRFEDLERTAVTKLAARRGGAMRLGSALTLTAPDPVAASRSLAFLPGVAWIAVGHRFEGEGAYLRSLVSLAERYLSKGRTFKLSAESAGSDRTSGDLVLSGNSEILASVPGAKVDERRPRVLFRACADGPDGAVGVEIRRGPGGVPTSKEWASCLASGGEVSSVLAWMAALSGYSIRLVHARSDDASFRQVAKLYSELSHRMDSASLELVVVDGERGPAARLGAWLRDHRGMALAGIMPRHLDEMSRLARKFPNLALPMLVVQRDQVSATYSSLGLGRPKDARGARRLSLDGLSAFASYSEKVFGGVVADHNAVIDSLTGPAQAHR
jgi:hypothetical protein